MSRDCLCWVEASTVHGQQGRGGKPLRASQKRSLSWDCQAVLLRVVLLSTVATGHTWLLKCWLKSELPHLTVSTFQELMRFHAGQSGHGKLHYHAGAFLRQSMVKEMAPATLCQEAVAAQGLLGRCCWKIWDSRLPPPYHHFLFSLIIIQNFNYMTGCLWFPHLWKNCWLFYAEKALDLTRIEMSSTWGEGALEDNTDIFVIGVGWGEN